MQEQPQARLGLTQIRVFRDSPCKTDEGRVETATKLHNRGVKCGKSGKRWSFGDSRRTRHNKAHERYVAPGHVISRYRYFKKKMEEETIEVCCDLSSFESLFSRIPRE